MGCGASTSAGQNLGRTSKIYSHGDEVIIQRFESHDLAGSKLKIRQDNYGSPKKQYDVERAIFCAELCNHVYLGDSIWASARSQRLKTIRDSKNFSFPCRVNLGYYASEGNNLKGLLGVELLGPEFDSGDVTDDWQATVCHGYLTHDGVSMQAFLLHDPVEKVLYVVFRGTEVDANFQDVYTDLAGYTVAYEKVPGARCHAGFSKCWAALKSVCVESVIKAIDLLDIKRVTVTGHSLGGSIATMCALSLAHRVPKLQDQGPNGLSASGVFMSVFTFGQCVVGNSEYQKAYNKAVPVHWLHQNDKDLIPRLLVMTGLSGYKHVGTRIFLDEDSVIIGATPKGLKSEKGDGEGGDMEFITDHSMNNYTCLLHHALAVLAIPPETVELLRAAWTQAVEGQGPEVKARNRPLCYVRKLMKQPGVELELPVEGQDAHMRGETPNWKALHQGLEAAGIPEPVIRMWPTDWMLVAKMRGRNLNFGEFLSALFRLHFDPETARRDAHFAIAHLYSWFLQADANLDGLLSLAECEAALSASLSAASNDANKGTITAAQIEEEFHKYDVNADLGLSFQELLLWVKEQPAFGALLRSTSIYGKSSIPPPNNMTASCKDRPKFNCYIGPWISKSGAVLAKEGICSSRATFTPDAVEAKVWFGVGEESFVYPEMREDEDGLASLKAKPDLAVCFSGGGFRACTNALGWARALHEMGILPKARYLCSNSGGSWFNTAFSYQDCVSNSTFLGPAIPPEQLTLARCKNLAPGSFGKVIANAPFKKLLVRKALQDLVKVDIFGKEDPHEIRAWSKSVGDCFFEAYGLNDHDATYALAGAAAAKVSKMLGAKVKVHTACGSPVMPFPVIVGSIAAPNDPKCFYTCEFTPQYFGVPTADIADSPAMAHIGGVLVEPVGANSVPKGPPPADTVAGGAPVTVELESKGIVPLVQAAGISSGYIAQMMADPSKKRMWEALGCEELHYWAGKDFVSKGRPFADGGSLDNLAIFPALRRGTRLLLVCQSASSPIQDDAASWAAWAYDVAGYFGAIPEGKGPKMGQGEMAAGLVNKICQVFEPARHTELHAALLAKQKAGDPVAARLKGLKVLANPTQGIVGGYEVEVLFVVTCKPMAFVNALPKETKEWLDDEKRSEKCPFVSTMKLDYDEEHVAVLSQMATHVMKALEPEVKALLAS